MCICINKDYVTKHKDKFQLITMIGSTSIITTIEMLI